MDIEGGVNGKVVNIRETANDHFGNDVCTRTPAQMSIGRLTAVNQPRKRMARLIAS